MASESLGLAVVALDMSGDALFDTGHPRNRDGWFTGFHRMRDEVQAAGWACHTHDWYQRTGKRPDVVLYLDIPRSSTRSMQRGWADDAASWVILQESELIIGRNWRKRRHAEFDLIFTWHDDYVDRPGYVRLDYSVPLTAPREPSVPFHSRMLCTMIAGNKRVWHSQELYSARIAVIKWFESNAPEAFDLYGVGWDLFAFPGPKPVRALNLIHPLRRMLAPSHRSYRGAVDRKADVLRNYRFAICFENARDMPGYITEKLLECFTAGVVPVYRGPANIAEIVDPNAYIDIREFGSLEALYEYMSSMSEDNHRQYLDAAKAWLRSPQAQRFSPDTFGKTVARELRSIVPRPEREAARHTRP